MVAADDAKSGSTAQVNPAWNLKFKSVSMKQMPGQRCQVRVTLEFTKDVDEKELKQMQLAFQPSAGIGRDKPETIVGIHFFDQDNVSIYRSGIMAVEGDISGKMGDAFRVVVTCPHDTYMKTKKVEPRQTKLK